MCEGFKVSTTLRPFRASVGAFLPKTRTTPAFPLHPYHQPCSTTPVTFTPITPKSYSHKPFPNITSVAHLHHAKTVTKLNNPANLTLTSTIAYYTHSTPTPCQNPATLTPKHTSTTSPSHFLLYIRHTGTLYA